MGYLCACLGGGKRSPARIGEKVQDFYGPSRMADQSGKPFPVYRLFGKQSGVFEAERL